jgi:uncharacterized membrane protein YfcA
MEATHVAAGALTGLVVGMTGVGGGALMTPILVLLFGTAPLTAVGTDLWFEDVTKLAVSGLHLRRRLIDWPIVRRLWLGSLPASVLTVFWMSTRQLDRSSVALVRTAIAVAVCVTAVGLLADKPLAAWRARAGSSPVRSPLRWEAAATVLAGATLGALVTLTWVGAGALGVVVLAHLYAARLTPPRLVATDIAHAIPLALCAGIGHLAISQVDAALLRDLLTGSIPAALAGAILSSHVSHAVLRAVLGAVLLLVGVTLFSAR